MKPVELNFFGRSNGIDFHLKVELDAESKPSVLIPQLSAALSQAGCTGKPLPGKGGNPGYQPPKPVGNCTACGAVNSVLERSGTSKAGKPYRLQECSECKDKVWL